MSSGILSVGQSALAAAQAGLATTGHNIANANTIGYSRQVLEQSSAGAQDSGFGFVGKGTQVNSIKRVYSEFLGTQVLNAQTSKNQLDTYYAQITRIDNLLADPNAGISPATQDFFKNVQAVATDPTSSAARQSLLSSGAALSGTFKSISDQLTELRDGVNAQITTSVGVINTYAGQIAQLNDSIEKATNNNNGAPPNDLLDQRDQVIADLSKEVKVSVVKQNSTYNVFVGNGQPLVVNTKTYNLSVATSPTDQSRLEVGYQQPSGTTVVLAENSLTGGGNLGGIFDFRAKSLDLAQNSLGQLANVIGDSFNAQHKLGQDQTGALGTNFFNIGAPTVTSSTNNLVSSTAVVGASISNSSALTTSDYTLKYDSTTSSYNVTRLSDGAVTNFATFPRTIDGVTLTLAGTPAANDTFLIQPTANGASKLSVALTDKTQIAAAAPLRTSAPLTNKGTATISAGSVNSSFVPATVAPAVTVTYDTSTTPPQLTGLPGGPVAYTSGSTITFGGASVTITGAPANGDTFTIGANTSGVGDNRNALLLAGLQTKNTLNGSTSTFQGAYSQLVNTIGNKAHELQITSTAATSLYTQAHDAQQAESGVNLDEEATNLLRYQQAYQAAGKVIQTSSQLFELLLTLGGQ